MFWSSGFECGDHFRKEAFFDCMFICFLSIIVINFIIVIIVILYNFGDDFARRTKSFGYWNYESHMEIDPIDAYEDHVRNTKSGH